jgi:HK97 family phage prohead protease
MRRKNLMKREVRTIKASELRARQENDQTVIEGYAARYNTLSHDLYPGIGLYERLMPGTFTRALREKQDVRHLINHDASLLLGRTASGTTELFEDARGLQFRTVLPDTQYARDLAVSIKRGDIDECSFGFIPTKVQWSEEKDADGNDIDVRNVSDVDLFDVSTVTFPAYPETDAHLAMRSLFANGAPDNVKRRAMDADGDDDGDMTGCACPCPHCQEGRCEMCSAPDCEEEMCMHGYPPNNRSLERRDDGKKTKRVDGEDLTAGAFLIVGDPEDTSTWKLPVKFSTESKTVSHLKNALARFDQMKDVSESEKKEAWHKLVSMAESHGIKVSDEDKAKHGEDRAAKAAREFARLCMIAIEASL